jgi:glycosyltransferase involved in cell wall biosynthesis
LKHRIAIASSVFFPRLGGVEEITDTLGRALSELGYRVTIVTSEPEGGSNSASTAPYDLVRTSSFFQAARVVLESELVIVMGPIFKFLLLALALRRPFLISHQILPATTTWHDRLKWAMKRLLLSRGAEVACSIYLARAMQRPHIETVPNPLRWSFSHDGLSRKKREGILFCGRLVAEKGGDLLLRALKRCCETGTKFQLTIVGSGPDFPHLQSLAKELGLVDQVTFAGPLRGRELIEAYQRHMILVVPSMWEEPFGLVALEGLASGCRVVVTDRGGLPEAVGKFARVCRPEPDALCIAILNALQVDLASGEQCQRELQSFIDRHSPTSFALSLLSAARRQAIPAAF